MICGRGAVKRTIRATYVGFREIRYNPSVMNADGDFLTSIGLFMRRNLTTTLGIARTDPKINTAAAA
jgi:hypothetical protein